jgi:hypothetical protein
MIGTIMAIKQGTIIDSAMNAACISTWKPVPALLLLSVSAVLCHDMIGSFLCLHPLIG